ncbi:hypothetical protein CCMA1212_004613 [Trichoderma ghanense]|uniref:Uncharacterized protein n=1 Tax=Trichoderma ghanense TaxID=65468 RepID=A0ABY2H518_9HYPO
MDSQVVESGTSLSPPVGLVLFLPFVHSGVVRPRPYRDLFHTFPSSPTRSHSLLFSLCPPASSSAPLRGRDEGSDHSKSWLSSWHVSRIAVGLLVARGSAKLLDHNPCQG